MEAKDLSRLFYFMEFLWNKESSVRIFGPDMGNHFYKKWSTYYGDPMSSCYKGSYHATVELFANMSEHYLQTLIDYALKH